MFGKQFISEIKLIFYNYWKVVNYIVIYEKFVNLLIEIL